MGKVSKKEFDKAMAALRHDGLSRADINDIKKTFQGDLDEATTTTSGVSREELGRRIKWMEEHPSQHHLSKDQIQKLKKELEEDF